MGYPPIIGLLGNSHWSKPIFDYCEKFPIRPNGEPNGFRSLFPHVSPHEWKINYRRCAPFAFAQGKLRDIASTFGFSKKCKLHSFRAWAPTCATQLGGHREDRGRLSHWAPGSAMPDRYDRAICTTELKVRERIFAKFRAGRRPLGAFQVAETPVAP